MVDIPVRDPTGFITTSYVLVGVVVIGAVVWSLLELRHWSKKARELDEARRAQQTEQGR